MSSLFPFWWLNYQFSFEWSISGKLEAIRILPIKQFISFIMTSFNEWVNPEQI
jgi:hypothetical protein